MKIKGDENMYTVNRHKFHKLYVCNETDEIPIGPFTRFEKEQLEKIVALLNEKNQLLIPIQVICEKYKIPIQDLPETLEEYISRDNE